MIKRVLTLCLFSLVVHTHLKAQFKSISFASPNAAELGEYGQVDVSYFNGLINTAIPLTELRAGNIVVPVSLSYHGGGIRKEEHPTWVGLGWNLAVGGAITRITNGKIDEYRQTSGDDPDKFSYLRNKDKLIGSKWISNNLLNSNNIDLSPDEFRFDFIDFSGSFMMDENGNFQVKTKSDQQLKVEYELKAFPELRNFYNPGVSARIPRAFYQFTITAKNGTKYIFGGDKDAIEYSRSSTAAIWGPPDLMDLPFDDGGIIATSWYLKEIVSPDGRKISFNYVRDGYQMIETKFYEIGKHTSDAGIHYNSYFPLGRKISWIRNLINSVYLKSIISDDGGAIEFNTSESTQLGAGVPIQGHGQTFTYFRDFFISGAQYPNKLIQLDEMVVKYGSAVRQKIKLKYYPNDGTERLKLSNVAFTDLNETVKQEYKFNYNSLKLPAYNAGQADHWGFYNNDAYFFDANTVTTDNARNIYPNYLDYLSPNYEKAQAEVLTEIVYPTGGKTKFFYELNQYQSVINLDSKGFSLQQLGQNKDCGGLRIAKTIADPDNTGIPVVTEYKYVKNYAGGGTVSSGILSGNPGYLLEGAYTYRMETSLYYKVNVRNDFWLWSTKNYEPLSNTNGSHITYSEVTEKFSDGSFKVYKYSNHDNGLLIDQAPTHISTTIGLNNALFWKTLAFTKMEFERGLLESRQIYNASKQLKEETNYYYNTNTNRYNSYVKSINTFHMPLIDDIFNSFIYDVKTTANVKYYIFNPAITKTVNKKYNDNSTAPLILEKNFVYDSYRNLREEKVIEDNNNVIRNLYTYPYDFTVVQPDLSNKTAFGVQELVDLRIFDKVVENITYKGKADGSGTSITGASLFTYKSNIPAIGMLDKVYHYENGTILTGKNNTIIDDTRFIKDDRYIASGVQPENYDEKGNVLQAANGGLKESYLWGYNQSLPTAKVINAENSFTRFYQPANASANLDIPTVESQINSISFKVYYRCSITFNTTFTAIPGQDHKVRYSYRLDGPSPSSGVMCTSSASNAALCSGYPSSITLNVLPGDYTLTVSTNLFSNTEPSTPIIRFSYLSRSTLQGGITEIFYEGFEEQADAATITPFAGLKYYNGDYTVPFITPNSKAYVVEYRYLTGGSWKHAKRPYTNNMILADGDAIDEVRVYPEDALMSTYTYQPLVGITSETDPSGKAIFYEYDPLGRLKVIKDQEGNIIKTVEYHYKTN